MIDQNQIEENLGKFLKRGKKIIIFTSMYYDVFREIYVLPIDTKEKVSVFYRFQKTSRQFKLIKKTTLFIAKITMKLVIMVENILFLCMWPTLFFDY